MPNVYKVNDGENIFDVALATYGSLELVYKIILDNNQLEDINADLPSLPGLSLTYDDTFIVQEQQGEKQIQLPAASNEYVIHDGQTIYDLALMLYGEVDKVIQIAQDNVDLIPDLNQAVPARLVVKFNSSLNENMVLTKYLVKNDLTINTAYPSVTPASGFSLGFKSESFF